MKKFSDFASPKVALDGDKIKLDDLVNREIVVLGYRIEKSRYSKNKSGDYLTLQVEVDGSRRIVFTGSDVLIDQLREYGKEAPFSSVIRKVNRFYTLS